MAIERPDHSSQLTATSTLFGHPQRDPTVNKGKDVSELTQYSNKIHGIEDSFQPHLLTVNTLHYLLAAQNILHDCYLNGPQDKDHGI